MWSASKRLTDRSIDHSRVLTAIVSTVTSTVSQPPSVVVLNVRQEPEWCHPSGRIALMVKYKWRDEICVVPVLQRFKVSSAGENNMTDATSKSGDLLSVNQVAKLCNVAPQSIYRWASSGMLPKPCRLGRGKNRTIRFRRADIEKWLSESCNGGGQS